MKHSGFTLIELSIVLVIIGLIVGGILTGRDLIDAAAQRAQITQIERYNTAVRTFQGKYGYLPGDITDPNATNFGFQPRGQYAGEGDGNGVLESNCNNNGNSGSNSGYQSGCGENGVFFQDLSTAGLVDGAAPYTGQQWPSTTASHGGVTVTTTPSLLLYLPVAKLNSNYFVYTYSSGGTNYFALSSMDHLSFYIVGAANPGITVQQAYNIDKKTDDGLPQSGRVTACYLNYNVVNGAAVWAAGNSLQGANGGTNCTPTTAATVPATTDCYGNNNTTGAMTYSVSSNGSQPNCALSFRFQ